MKINKALTLGVVGLSAVIFGGCLTKDTEPTKDPEKIANMMEAGDPMYCVMSTTESGKMETWTKGEKVKAYGTSMGGSVGMGYMITDGEWTYIWAEGETKGTKYPVTDEEEFRSEGEIEIEEIEEPEFSMQEELDQAMVSDYEYECNKANIPDSTFVPPSNIEFKDVMKEMEAMMGDLENLGGSLEDYKF